MKLVADSLVVAKMSKDVYNQTYVGITKVFSVFRNIFHKTKESIEENFQN